MLMEEWCMNVCMFCLMICLRMCWRCWCVWTVVFFVKESVVVRVCLFELIWWERARRDWWKEREMF